MFAKWMTFLWAGPVLDVALLVVLVLSPLLGTCPAWLVVLLMAAAVRYGWLACAVYDERNWPRVALYGTAAALLMLHASLHMPAWHRAAVGAPAADCDTLDASAEADCDTLDAGTERG